MEYILMCVLCIYLYSIYHILWIRASLSQRATEITLPPVGESGKLRETVFRIGWRNRRGSWTPAKHIDSTLFAF